MSYVYKIKNDINNKVYIGKTTTSIEQRFKEHIRDSKKGFENRPLYKAMNKYGVEHFSIEQVEECNENVLNDREKYWIEYYGSFKNGYNATLGGDGATYLDYDLVISTYKELKCIKDTAIKLNICEDSVHNILAIRQEQIYSSSEVCRQKYSHIIKQYDLSGNYIQSFPTARAAAESVRGKGCPPGTISHITDVCRGTRKTAYGFKWQFDE